MNRRQSIITARSFGGFDKSFDSILKTCKLIHDPENWKIWHDDIGNKLELDINKYYKITKSTIKSNYKNTTDIYFKSKSEQIAKASQWFAFLIGKDVKNIEHIFIWFLGRDTRLRLCVLKSGKWVENLPPIIQNFDLLLEIAKHIKKQNLTKVYVDSFEYKNMKLSNIECFCGQFNNKNIRELRKKTKHKKRVMESLGKYA